MTWRKYHKKLLKVAKKTAVFTRRQLTKIIKWFSLYTKRLLCFTHHKTTKRLHLHLLRRFRTYAKYWEREYHRHLHIVLGALALLIFTGWFIHSTQSARALSQATVGGVAQVVNHTATPIYFDGEHNASVLIDNVSRQFSGHAWNDDIGWVNFGGGDTNPAGPVIIGFDGVVSGSAKALNGGLIQFAASGASVTLANGSFTGHAWSEDLGWIDFSGVTASGYTPDLLPPDNPSVSGTSTSGGATLTSGNWYNHHTPYFSWSAPDDYADIIDPSGIAGYYVYFGTNASADPTDYQTTRNFTATDLGSSNGTYYLRIKTKDVSGNISSAVTAFTYRYEVTSPTPPTYVSVSPSGYSRTNHFTFNWPVSGPDAAVDTGGSELRKYQYKINNEASWHDISGNSATSQIALNDKASSGVNTFDLRAVDEAGNASIPVRTNFYYNDSSPTAPRDLTVTPASSSTNSFAFSWTAPPGEIEGYYYSINVLPTANNVSYTTATSLTAGPYATQQGENTFYIVAEDSTGNYDLSSCNSISGNPSIDGCAKVTFTANTVAPGIPGNLQAYDISDRETKDYAAAVKWVPPADPGPNFAGYDIYRSADGNSYTKVGTTTGTIYSDGNLESKKYYYYAKAKDNAGKYSANSSIVTITPTGRYTTAPKMVSAPTFSVGPSYIEVKWATDRPANSFVRIENDNTFVSEQGQTTQTTDHKVKVVGLRSQSDYTFSVQSTDVDGNTLSGSRQRFTTLSTPSIYQLDISNITQTSAIVNFKSTAVANFTLMYGPTSSYGKVVQESSTSATTNHSLMIRDLAPGQMYFFRIIGSDSDGNELRSDSSFTTLPVPAISNLAIQPVKDAATTTLTVSWQTNVPTSSTVDYSASGVKPLTKSSTEMKLVHEITLPDLADMSTYSIVASGRDQFGNMAESNKLSFDTPKDSRPPKISDIKTEASNIGNSSSQARIAISWTTDEPSTSQIEFGPGLTGTDYTRKTTLDDAFTTHHLVIVSGLDPGTPYHLRVRSSDNAGNLTTGNDRTVITGEVPKTGLQVITNTLRNIFSWM